MREIPLVAFSIDRNHKLSLQKQVQAIVVNGILSKKFPDEARMPSSRALSDYLNVSRITVALAYAELASIGYLSAKDRSGYYIAKSEEHPTEPTLAQNADPNAPFSPKFTRRYTDARHVLVRPDNWYDYPYSFVYGQADPTIIDHHNWRQCSLEAIGRRDFDHLSYDSYEHDDPMLIANLLRINLPRRGIYAEKDEVLITMGALNALWLCANLMLDKDKLAVIENPCYPTLREMITRTDCQHLAIDIDEHGLPPQNIPNNASLVYTTPSHHCPTNISMPTKRRMELLAHAQKHNMVIVEDDYEFENQLKGAPKPALKSLDKTGNVIYVGSFSKSLFPALRLGYMVASKEIIAEARALRSLMIRNPPSHIQRSVAYFQSFGYYDSQLKRLARAYDERHKIMKQAIIDHKLEFASPPNLGGSSFWMKTPRGLDSRILATLLEKKGVIIEPGGAFFSPENPQEDFYRLGYSYIKPEKIRDGIALIKATLNELT